MTRTSVFYFASLAFLLALAVSCTSDNEEDVIPQPQVQQCDTANVTFSQTVAPILAANCYSCHSTAIATNGVVLDTHTGVKKQADNGSLIGVINHANGFPPMPQGSAKLSSCNIAKIQKWVTDGAINN